MEQQFTTEVLEKLKRKKRKSIWKRVLSVMICMVVFWTTYALILPAITKKTGIFCGYEQHKHTSACFPQQGELICGLEEGVKHVHSSSCNPVTSITALCEREESEGHTHTEACDPIEEKFLACDLQETTGHTHTDQCTKVETVLSCSLTEADGHSHTDVCYTTVTVYDCGLEETQAHAHSDGCYTITVIYNCGQKETPAHRHTADCFTSYSCGSKAGEAHFHTASCYASMMKCSLEENSEHAHSAACYSCAPICGMEEHEHGLMCYSDPTADLESAAVWEAGLPKLSGTYETDVLAIAKSQLNYTESTKNYIVDDADNVNGYTRYGAWYGAPYGEWCAMFVSFCLHYAGVEDVPLEAYCPDWVDKLQKQGLYEVPSEYIPKAGDIIFFDWEENGVTNHVGLVEGIEDTNVLVIEGNMNGRVVQSKYALHDTRIAGYGTLSEHSSANDQSDDKDTDALAVLIGPVGMNTQPPEQAQTHSVTETGHSLRKAQSAYRRVMRDNGSLDLEPYINSVNMFDFDGNPIASGSVVTEGDLIEFKIEYTITGQQMGVMNGENITVYSKTLAYTVPKTFQMIKSSSGNIVNSAGMTVGTYVVDSTTGNIVLNFLDDYVEQNAKGVQIHGYVSFFSTVTKITDEDGEEQEFKFTDNITLGVVIEEHQEAIGALAIEKEKASIDGEDIIYEIKVTSTEGTNGPITITDQMSKGLSFKEGISVKRGNGTTVSSARFNTTSARDSFTMTLPQMAAGDSYTIRYRCTADMNLLDADMMVKNTATVSGKDSQDNELKDEVTVDHIFDVLQKTGVSNNDGTITWTITINRAKVDISGWVLEDIISTGNGSNAYTGKVTVKNLSGNVLYENVSLPITFPQGSNDTYVITYTTAHGLADGDMIYNKAVLKDNDTEVTVVTGTGVGTPIEKTGVAGEVFQDANGNYLLPITWTVTIDTSGGPIPADRFFYDKMDGYPSDDSYMTYDQLMEALHNIEAEVIRVTGQETMWFEAAVYEPGNGNHGDIYGILDLWANVDNCQSFVYERFTVLLGVEIPQGELLTFSYETYGIFPNNIVSTTMYKNRFNISEQHEVEGRVDYVEGTVKATKYAVSYFDPDNPDNPEWHWGTIHWNGVEGISRYDYERLFKGYLTWAIELSVPPNFSGNGDIVIYEDLPEGVAIKAIEMPFNGDLPAPCLKLYDIVPGNTYSLDFTLLPADQYGAWRPQGGRPASITVNVTDAGDLEIIVPSEVFETMAQRAALEKMEEWWGHLYIYTQIKEDFQWTETEEGSFVYVNNFENRFTIVNENGTVLDIGSQTQEITKNEKEDIIRKEASTDSNNIITYSVVLNAYKRDLIENSGTLRIHDELTYKSTDAQPLRLRLVPGSVKLYEIVLNADETYTKVREVTANYSYEETSSVQYGITTWVHTIELNVPDGKALLLEYAYKATGDKEVRHNVLNTCTIEGAGQGSLDGDSKVEIEVKDATAQADTKGVMIYKVDADSDGIFLEKARFNIYIWNEEQNKYIIVHHPENGGTDFTTDSNGMIVLDNSTMGTDQFAYNTAYYIVEVESPTGYYLGPEPYYFYIVNDDHVVYPSCIPNGFTGHALRSGDIIYRQNVSETTEIKVEKYWKDYNGFNTTVTEDQVSHVTFELWQMLRGDPGSAKLYGTYDMTPDEEGNWHLTITDLPKATKNPDGTKGTEFLYYIKEVDVDGFILESSVNNDGINLGTIRLINRGTEGYNLPRTGGIGTQMYTMVGMLMILFSATYLMYMIVKRRREDSS